MKHNKHFSKKYFIFLQRYTFTSPMMWFIIAGFIVSGLVIAAVMGAQVTTFLKDNAYTNLSKETLLKTFFSSTKTIVNTFIIILLLMAALNMFVSMLNHQPKEDGTELMLNSKAITRRQLILTKIIFSNLTILFCTFLLGLIEAIILTFFKVPFNMSATIGLRTWIGTFLIMYLFLAVYMIFTIIWNDKISRLVGGTISTLFVVAALLSFQNITSVPTASQRVANTYRTNIYNKNGVKIGESANISHTTGNKDDGNGAVATFKYWNPGSWLMGLYNIDNPTRPNYTYYAGEKLDLKNTPAYKGYGTIYKEYAGIKIEEVNKQFDSLLASKSYTPATFNDSDYKELINQAFNNLIKAHNAKVDDFADTSFRTQVEFALIRYIWKEIDSKTSTHFDSTADWSVNKLIYPSQTFLSEYKKDSSDTVTVLNEKNGAHSWIYILVWVLLGAIINVGVYFTYKNKNFN